MARTRADHIRPEASTIYAPGIDDCSCDDASARFACFMIRSLIVLDKSWEGPVRTLSLPAPRSHAIAPVLVRDGPLLRADLAIAPGMVGNLSTPMQVWAA